MSTPPAELLQRAFDAVRLPDWPETYAEAARDAVRQQLVWATAERLAKGHGVNRDPWRPPTKPLPEPRPLRFDIKRIAAGEREDD